MMEFKTYILGIENKKDAHIQIGKLGNLFFKEGYYLYIGSAKKALTQRLARHLDKDKRRFWHIDYLLSSKDWQVRDIWVANDMGECQAAGGISQRVRTAQLTGFGSSDCRCRSHLIFLKDKLAGTKRLIGRLGFKKINPKRI